MFERAVLRQMLELHHGELRVGAAVDERASRPGCRMPARLTAIRSAPRRAGGSSSALTPRELEVLRLMARGQTNLEIATALVVREGTVKYHVKNILRKLGATSRADAVARFARSSGRR